MRRRALAPLLLLALAACATGRPSSREPSRILPRPVEVVRRAVVETLVANGLEVKEGPGWIDGHLAGSPDRRPVSLRVWTAPAGEGRTALWVDLARDGALAPTAGGAGFVGQGVAARLRREGEAGWEDAPDPKAEDPRRARFATLGGANAPLSTAARGRGTTALTAVGALIHPGEAPFHLLLTGGVRWPLLSGTSAPVGVPVDLLAVLPARRFQGAAGVTTEVVDGRVAAGGLLQASLRLGSPAGWWTGTWAGPVVRLRLTPRPSGVSLDVGMLAVF